MRANMKAKRMILSGVAVAAAQESTAFPPPVFSGCFMKWGDSFLELADGDCVSSGNCGSPP